MHGGGVAAYIKNDFQSDVKFDLVIAPFRFLSHFVKPELQLQLLQNIHQLLKQDTTQTVPTGFYPSLIQTSVPSIRNKYSLL